MRILILAARRPQDSVCLLSQQNLACQRVHTMPSQHLGATPKRGHTSALADANRSCGPPKPGRRLLNGVRRCRRGSAGGPLGPDRAPESPWGPRGVPRGPVHRLCIDTGQSSDLSSPDGSRRANPSEPRFGPRGPDEPRRMTRLSRISVQLIYGPIRDHTGP